MNQEYKLSEDHRQTQYLNDWGTDVADNGYTMYSGLRSCKFLARRFIHSANEYWYGCEIDEVDGCPKANDRGVANKSCLTEPYEPFFGYGADNSDQGELEEK